MLHNSSHLTKYVNDSSLEWSKKTNENYDVCYTLTISDEITSIGLKEVRFFGKKKNWLQLYVHQNGLFLSDMPGSSPSVRVDSKIFMFPLEHEVIQLLDYNGKSCNKSQSYRFDECQHDYIYKVNMSNLNELNNKLKRKCHFTLLLHNTE